MLAPYLPDHACSQLKTPIHLPNHVSQLTAYLPGLCMRAGQVYCNQKVSAPEVQRDCYNADMAIRVFISAKCHSLYSYSSSSSACKMIMDRAKLQLFLAYPAPKLSPVERIISHVSGYMMSNLKPDLSSPCEIALQ